MRKEVDLRSFYITAKKNTYNNFLCQNLNLESIFFSYTRKIYFTVFLHRIEIIPTYYI